MNKIRIVFRVKRFLFIRDKKFSNEILGAVYDGYGLYKRVLPFIYVWTGVWTAHERGTPVNHDMLRRIIDRYKEKGYV